MPAPAPIPVLELLFERFPNCFVRFERRRRPLKVGLHLDLLRALDGEVTAAELSHALSVYTGNLRYLDACKIGAGRIDLAGNVVGEVLRRHAAQASEQWARRAQRQAARRAQQDKERAEAAKAAAKALFQSSIAGLRAAGQRRKAAAS